MTHPFALTRKPYDTPLGSAPVDVDFVEALAARAHQDCFAAEVAHRNEHSIEFQAVFLKYLFAGRRDVRIVPVLTSFVHEALAPAPRAGGHAARAPLPGRARRGGGRGGPARRLRGRRRPRARGPAIR